MSESELPVGAVNDDLGRSVERIWVLADRALECADSGSDPRSSDAWWRLAAGALPAQLLALGEAAGLGSTLTVGRPVVLVGCDTASECLRQVQVELDSWDWDGLDRGVLQAGARLVLAVSDLLVML